MQAQILAVQKAVLCFDGTSEEGQIYNMPFGNVSLAFQNNGTTALKAEVTKLHDSALTCEMADSTVPRVSQAIRLKARTAT